jgi:SAM-dependent methyltransferase
MNFKDKVEVVYGIDPDPDIKQNSYLDNAAVGNGESLPYEENTFDVVISDNVLEHLVNPEKVFKEVHRVLKPGGYYLFKTPNKYHYMPLIARLTPHFFHEWINERRGRESKDTFPTQYLANSRSDINKLANCSKFNVDSIKLYEKRPEYLRFSPPTYIAGFLYERLVNSFYFLEGYRVLLVGILKKPG